MGPINEATQRRPTNIRLNLDYRPRIVYTQISEVCVGYGHFKGSLDAAKLSIPHCALLASVNCAAGALGPLKCSSRHRTTKAIERFSH